MDLSAKVFQAIENGRLTKMGDTILVGVSGGPDSVALLHILYGLRHRLGIKLHVAHFNHRLRPQAQRDEDFVKDLAKRLSLPMSVDRRQGRLKTLLASEDQARQWRLTFFAKVARQTKAKAIALAHTQNDLAETVLMRLLRGSGLLGLRGILSEHQMRGTKLIRPLLAVARSEIQQYLKSHRLKFCHDFSNEQTHYLRNRIRLKLIPYLVKQYNSNVYAVLVDLADISRTDYDYLLKQARKLFKEKVASFPTKVKINLCSFLSCHLSIRRMILRLAFEHLAGDFNQLAFTHIKEAEDLLQNRPAGTLVHWPQGVKILKSKKELILSI